MLLKFLQQKHCLQLFFLRIFKGDDLQKNCGTEKNVLSDH